jgi:hypothetical protein
LGLSSPGNFKELHKNNPLQPFLECLLGGIIMTFQRELALAGLLLTAPLLSLPAEAEDKKSTSSAPARPAPAPVVRAAPAPVVRAPAPVVRAAPAPVVRAAPAPVVRAPATVTATRPASTVVVVKPAATVAVKPAATVATKPAATTAVKPAVTTTAIKPATTATKPASTAAVKPATTTAGTTSNIDRARNRIQSELPADGAVRGDTQKKPSVVGVQASEFKPKVTIKRSAEPPSPGQPNFPKRAPNDPAPTNPLTTR